MASSPQTVLILLADISGYTQYMLLHQKALEHSQMVVGELLNTLLEIVPAPLDLIRLEGDAIFLYAPFSTDPETRRPPSAPRESISGRGSRIPTPDISTLLKLDTVGPIAAAHFSESHIRMTICM